MRVVVADTNEQFVVNRDKFIYGSPVFSYFFLVFLLLIVSIAGNLCKINIRLRGKIRLSRHRWQCCYLAC
jgi:hypothetical protein